LLLKKHQIMPDQEENLLGGISIGRIRSPEEPARKPTPQPEPTPEPAEPVLVPEDPAGGTRDGDEEDRTDIPEPNQGSAGKTICYRCAFEDVPSRCTRTSPIHIYRRAWTERRLNEILPVDLERGFTYHVISTGDIDSLSYIRHILRREKIPYALISTWTMMPEAADEIREWLANGLIGYLDFYTGDALLTTYRQRWKQMGAVMKEHGRGGRLGIFMSHAKIVLGVTSRYAFGIETSANVSTNRRAEFAAITTTKGIFQFYKKYYDSMKVQNREFDDWKPFDADPLLDALGPDPAGTEPEETKYTGQTWKP
jgi:hypothetical protein